MSTPLLNRSLRFPQPITVTTLIAVWFTTASWTWAVSPAVTFFGPGTNAKVSVASDIYFEFDQDVFAGTGMITLNGGTTNVHTIPVSDTSQVKFFGRRITINPTNDLASLMTYSVQIDPGAVRNGANLPFGGITNTNTYPFLTGRILYAKALRANGSSVGSGTLASPYESIGYASTRATNAGDTIYILDSAGPVARSYTLAATGTTNAPVVIKPAPGQSGFYQFSGLNNFIIGSSTNLLIEGFTFSGGSEQTGAYEIASHPTQGFWQQNTPAAVPLGGIAINVAGGSGITIRDNVFKNLQQKAINIESGRYVRIVGNIIHNVATTSLSGGHGIMRQQGTGNFGTADEAGRYRWEISGNLIFNVQQRLYSWVPSKGYLNMTLDEGKPINIDETTDTSMAARISDNVIAFAQIDSIRLKPTPNLEVVNNSIYSTAPHADGITDANTLTSSSANFSNPFPGMVLFNNLVMTATGTLGYEVNDAFPTTAATSCVADNLVLGGGVNPTSLPGITTAGVTNLFVSPGSGQFSPAPGISPSLGAHPAVLADLAGKAAAKSISVQSDGWGVDHLKLTQILLDSIPADGSVFTLPGVYTPSAREAGRKSIFFTPNATWKTANGVTTNQYEIITPLDYSIWRDGITSQYPGYANIRWGESVLGQNKSFATNDLLFVSLFGTNNYTRTVARTNQVALAGDLLVELNGYTPSHGDSFDLMEAATLSSSGTNPFSQVRFTGLALPSNMSYQLSLVHGATNDVLRLSFIHTSSGGVVADPSLAITPFGPSSWRLLFAGPSHKSYRIEKSTDLSNTNSWMLVTNQVSDATGGFEWVDTDPTNSRAFYRAMEN